jgi:hypothetical protein
LLEFDELKATRLEKVSLAGVPGLEGGFEAPPTSGVDLPEAGGVGRKVAEAELELAGGGFLVVCGLDDVQSSPERSSMAIERRRASQRTAQKRRDIRGHIMS